MCSSHHLQSEPNMSSRLGSYTCLNAEIHVCVPYPQRETFLRGLHGEGLGAQKAFFFVLHRAG